MKKTIILLLLVFAIGKVAGQKWSLDQANNWYNKQGTIIGANFLPSTAINQLEMWQEDTFDPMTIDKELGYAAEIGMNTMRVYLHDLLFVQDSTGFFNRMNQFLDIADKNGIKIMFVFFDSCWNDDPLPGLQPEPVPGKHNSGWVRSPGTKILFDHTKWPILEIYVKSTLGHFKNDTRVLAWDLFNEPSNNGYKDACIPLLSAVFQWAQQLRPSQPLTAGIWNEHEMSNGVMLKNSDIITFHNYGSPESLEKKIIELKKNRRPLICTEYMARKNKSLFETCLPVFKKYQVGAINWGLVAGKSNTIYAWNEPIPDGSEPELWFHDIFRKDGTAYKESEIKAIKSHTGKE